jgi:sedoheptulose-bisphosphatase
VNSFGDEQLAVDMLADKLLFEALRFSVSGRLRSSCVARNPCIHL